MGPRPGERSDQRQLSHPVRSLRGVLLPTTCPCCGARGPAPCLGCAAELRRAPALPVPSDLDSCAALLTYEGVGRELVARLKYRNARAAAGFLAGAMAALVDPAHVDVVTWAPTTAARRRRRGFDQAALLARLVARRVGRPCRPLLTRPPGPPQTGRAGAARRQAPLFAARPSTDAPAGARVLLVDDVVTTGATMTAAARALRAAGAAGVHGLAAARTPLKPRAQWSERTSDATDQCDPRDPTGCGRENGGRAVGPTRGRRTSPRPSGAER